MTPDLFKNAMRKKFLIGQIAALKANLSSTDYKIIKIYEYSLLTDNAAMPCPYDCEDVHRERQAIRDQINVAESQLENLD